MPRSMSTTPIIISARFMRETLAQKLYRAVSSCLSTHPYATGARGIVRKAGKVLRTAGGSGGSNFLGSLGGFRGRRCFAAPLGLRRRGRSFADELRRHHAGDEELGPVIIKINRCTLLVRCRHNSKAVHIMLDCLPFLHCLHNVLLDNSLDAD